jgi:uncharacterized protein YbjQ (UPF0145 family)
MELLINLIFFVGLVLLGFFAGTHAERKHLRSIEAREHAFRDMPVTDLKTFPAGVQTSPTPKLIVGEVSIASDYLKTLLASLRNLIGGEVASFESLLQRARREAVLRLMEQARAEGYDAIANLRMESADIGGNVITNQKNSIVVTSVIASGTAYRRGIAPQESKTAEV